MESASNWEYKMLTDELTRGMDKAVQLRLQLCSTSPSEAENLLLERIISSFQRALYTLKWSGNVGQAQGGAATSATPESSVSVDRSPGTEGMSKNFMDHHEYGNTSKKRKAQPARTEQVKVSSENGLEGPGDDGYSWRKYGQKDILGAKFPRSYYRCTYRAGRNCWATKQVQRSDDDPTLFEITYKGTHTCIQSNNEVPSSSSPEKQAREHGNSHSYQLEQNHTLLNFKSNLRVNTEELDIQEMPVQFSFPSAFAGHKTENNCSPITAIADDNHLGTYSPFFYSPEASASNCFSAATYQMRDYGGVPLQQLETDVVDIISAHASTTNSPVGGMDFSIDSVDIDPNFPYNMPGFFT